LDEQNQSAPDAIRVIHGMNAEFEQWWSTQKLWNPSSEAAKDVAYSAWREANRTKTEQKK
jgi:hypothetical protein